MGRIIVAGAFHTKAEPAGYSLKDLPPLGRACAVSVMTLGASRILTRLIERGETRTLVGGSDVTMLYPILDIEGDNSILRGMTARLAHVTVALLWSGRFQQGTDPENSVALTMYGVTNICVTHCRNLLATHGRESLVFHANGTGGRSFESFISQGLVSSVIDLTISEMTDELFGGLWTAGPDRLTAASRSGVPQVVAPGAIDMICLGPRASIPQEFRNRTYQAHSDLVTLVRTTPDENYRLGQTVAERLGNPAATATVLVPMKGVSQLDFEGGPFYDPKSVDAFAEGVQSGLFPNSPVSLVKMEHHINDTEFAEALVAAVVAQ